MRIAIITYSWSQNWGAILQAYALVEYLNSNGHEAQLINYREFDNKLISTVKSIPDGIIDFLTLSASRRRIKRYNEFRNNELRLTFKCNSTEELSCLSEQFDAFITGSDQVWNVGLGVCKDFYLHFVKSEKRRISYVASFGVSEIPDKYKEETINGLNNIQFISVREKSGQKIVKELTGRDTTLVLDPVFLLEPEHWMRISTNVCPKRKYIFVYPTQITKTLTKSITLLKKQSDLEVISPFYIPGCKVVKDIGPREFINYIANAEYVLTSSFHAAAFSILFMKKLFVITHSKTGSRTTDLLASLGMSNRIINDYQYIFTDEIDYSNIKICLERLKDKSKLFLFNALK